MTYVHQDKLQAFERDVLLKYKIFNGLFLDLPFDDPDQAGALLPLFAKQCSVGLAQGKTAPQIINEYLAHQATAQQQPLHLLVKFLQFIERQVVLFDALEYAAFSQLNDLSGYGTVDYLLTQFNAQDNEQQMLNLERLLRSFRTRLVLTAHPTQFYPTAILGIINALRQAIIRDDIAEVRDLFLQMGLTRFGNQNKPTPVDEAHSIIWFLENVFYQVIPQIQHKLPCQTTCIELGFWPGGDRDGNPFVTAEVTLEVADKLRSSLLRCYYQDLQALRRRLTFAGISELLTAIALKIRHDSYLSSSQLITDLQQVSKKLSNQYHGLFVNLVQDLIKKINLFHFYFAKIDIRQNSSIHRQVVADILRSTSLCPDYLKLAEDEKIKLLSASIDNQGLSNGNYTALTLEVIATLQAVQTIQAKNGLESIERYVISNTDSVASILEVLWLAQIVNNDLANQSALRLEIVPLFETIEDLANADQIMETLYNLPIYQKNLKVWQQQQTIMLGFSDGTKDGGYLMANWAIFQAKKRLSKLAAKYDIAVVFFDGRGGPPSRGGGETYAFYQSLAQEIEDNQIQLTVQGQSIPASFGTIDSAGFNIEHLLSAGISGRLLTERTRVIDSAGEKLINQLAELSFEAYSELRYDPLFVPYLEEITPLKYLSEANIGSRPAKRSQAGQLKLEDLRAIPFGGAWMQMKQNILGYYGLGTALSKMIREDHANVAKFSDLYQSSLLFKGLLDNSMQSLANTNFAITRHLQSDVKFGGFWQKIYAEAQLAQQLLLLISRHDKLIANNPVKWKSIQAREEIVLPLLVIQQFAMNRLRCLEHSDPDYALCEKIIKKSLAASINSSRNSI
ncbi:MAG: phosphoenolpyruvate carboxylase [Burkholderiales bacterium]|nr:phosphoenolpyruvate carboxylase [Burkholderiales bacterium]